MQIYYDFDIQKLEMNSYWLNGKVGEEEGSVIDNAESATSEDSDTSTASICQYDAVVSNTHTHAHARTHTYILLRAHAHTPNKVKHFEIHS